MDIKLTFTELATDFVLESFGKKTDKDGYIVEAKNPKQRVLTRSGLPINKQEFAGVIKGSEIFIKDDFVSLVELYDELKKRRSNGVSR